MIYIEADKQFPCFCEACLRDKTEEQMSQKDIRYCVDCQPIIEEEYRLQSPGKRTRYKPIPATKIKGGLSPHIHLPITKQKEVLLPIKNATDQIYQNPTENRPIPNVGGRPRKDVPTVLIKELSVKDMGIKQIVKELKAQGHKISAMTVSRVLSGERKCVIMPPLSLLHYKKE